MRTAPTALIILLTPIACFATGWNDFELDIGDGYRIFRCNSLDVCVGKAGGTLLVAPGESDSIGPVVRYFTTDGFIFAKTLGKKPRNLFEGDTFQEIDPSQEFYFVISKGNDQVIGPVSQSDFAIHPDVTTSGSIDWQVPRNPNVLMPLFGALLFLAIAIPILAVKYFWVSVPLTVAMVMLISFVRRKRKLSRMAGGP